MASKVTQKTSPEGKTFQDGQKKTKLTINYRGRTVVPVAHGGEAGGGGVSLTTLMLIVGAILWGLGAQWGNPSMVLAGQILTGIPLASTGLALLLLGCVCCY